MNSIELIKNRIAVVEDLQREALGMNLVMKEVISSDSKIQEIDTKLKELKKERLQRVNYLTDTQLAGSYGQLKQTKRELKELNEILSSELVSLRIEGTESIENSLNEPCDIKLKAKLVKKNGQQRLL